MIRLRFSKKEVHTPLTTDQMVAQLEAVNNEADVETSMLKTFQKDEKGYFLSHPHVELEPGMVPAIEKARRLSLIQFLLKTSARIRRTLHRSR
jgi:hypothetical protein